MADQHIGYPGSVSSSQLASWIPNVGSARYSVEDVTHAQVVTNTIGDRGITVLPGTLYGDGIMDVFETGTNLNFAASTSGDRWDMVVLRRTWNATPGASTSVYTIIQGGVNRSLPSRNTNRGTISDQPIALCRLRAGASSVQEIVDLRCWADNGGLVAVSDLVMSYQDQLGTDVTIGTERWIRTLTIPPVSGGTPAAYWHRVSAGGTIHMFGWGGALFGSTPNISFPPQFRPQGGTLVATTDGAGYARINYTPFPNGLLTMLLFNGDGWAAPNTNIAGAGAPWGDQGTGNLSTYVYGVWVNGTLRPNYLHRVNWIAIGW